VVVIVAPRRTFVAAAAAGALLLALTVAPRPGADRAIELGPGTVSAGRGAGPIAPVPQDAFRAVEVEVARIPEIVDPPRSGDASAAASRRSAAELRPTVVNEPATERVPAAAPTEAAGASGGGTGGSSGAGAIPTSGWRWPLSGPITQRFNSTHLGIDIDGDTGDVAVAAHAGTVVGAGWLTECGGLQVHVRIASGVETWYQHLSAKLVRVGQEISAGTPIGKVGATGCAQGSHLHFAIRRGTTFVNPLPYLP
jgi:murein DD-endopeptidase MepM/ murein hydrolase activator NlpD